MEEPTNPSHYRRHRLQPIDVIEDWELNYRLGSALKYIGRYRYKDNPIVDLEKAVWYLEREIEHLKASEILRDQLRLDLSEL